jgi:glycosyltransferase involved in cell wall biosynthesis
MNPELSSDVALVSVIVPVYNHARFLCACFDSIAAETYPNVELLVIDDGSSDGSFDVAKEWIARNSGRFARVELEKQENAGITVSLNRLLRMTRGDYIVLLASDDILLPGGISARVAALRENPRWLSVIGDCIVIDESGTLIHHSGFRDYAKADKEALQHSQTIETEMIWRWSAPGPVLMSRRTAYFDPLGVGFYPEDLRVEDRYFYLAVLSKHALGFIDVPVAGYRLHPDQSITKPQARVREWVLETEARFVGKFTGLSSLGLWIHCQRRYVNITRFKGRVLNAILWRAERYIGGVVCHINSRKARKLSRRRAEKR